MVDIKKYEGNIQFFGTKAGAKLDHQVEIFTAENGYLVPSQSAAGTRPDRS